MAERKSVPDIRFSEFGGDWEQRRVEEITVESLEYTTLSSGLPLLTSSRNGLMYQNEYRGNQTTESAETLFSVVPLGACTYRHMSDDDVFHLNINTIEKGLVSREYPVFSATEENNIDFIVQHINSSASFLSFCAEQKKGGTRTRLYYKTLCEFKMMVPTLEEQKQISKALLQLDSLITLHQSKLGCLQSFKKAMLDKMFPKDGAAVPEIRFNGFSGDWEQRKLGDTASSFEYGLNAAAKEYDGINKYLRITDIDDSSRVFKSDDLTSPDADFSISDSYRLRKGDVLFARTGASVGKTYIYRETDGLVYFAGFLIRASIKHEYDAEFIFQNTLTSSYEKFIQITSQRSGQPGVNAQEYAEYSFLTPNYAEQKKIGGFLRQIDNLIVFHQRKLDCLRNIKEACLEKMFV